ncbi:MAG TPA: hypothetical protein VF499_15120, partial [Afipia sp.]
MAVSYPGWRRAAEYMIRHCEERLRRSNPVLLVVSGLLRGACHRAALCADPLARNDGLMNFAFGFTIRLPAR